MSGLTIDGLRWEVRVRGTEVPLLLLHGFMGRGSTWDRHARAFARLYRVVVVDLPGHGRSGIPPDARRGSVERMADDLAEILDRVGCAPAHVLGYSLGARVALRLAVAHPLALRRLVLEGPSAGLTSEVERAARRAADSDRAERLERDGIAAFVDDWEREPIFSSLDNLPRARAARLRADRLRNRPNGLAASLRTAGQGSMEPLQPRLAEVRSPTLIIAGALDPIGRQRAESVAAGITGARLETIDRAGHVPHIETPALFRRLVIDFLKEDLAA